MAAALIVASAGLAARAADGDGGAGGDSTGTSAGGTASATSPGSDGTDGVSGGIGYLSGGAGGGSGLTGGSGGAGAGSSPGSGGAGASVTGAAGSDGTSGGNDSSGGGGGGGAHAYVGTIDSLPTSGTFTGGAGGNGGAAGFAGYGGGGGGGGFGAVITGLTGSGGTIIVSATGGAGGSHGWAASGGNGGSGLVIDQSTGNNTIAITGSVLTGGAGGGAAPGVSVSGGDGGSGLVLNGGTGANTLVISGGSISGGDAATGTPVGSLGGDGGNGILIQSVTGLTTLNIETSVTGGAGRNGLFSSGEGGSGIVGENLAVSIAAAGSVTGGLSGDGTRSAALNFLGGSNTLTLESGATVTGGIVLATNTTSLELAQTTDYTLSNVISGNGAISKTGAGTLTLSGNSSGFSGSSSVTGGELAVNGTLGGDVTVGSGGTLGGTGSISGTVTVSGTLAAGQSPGTLTVGTLVLNSGSVSEFELGQPGVVGGTDNDLVIVTGDLTLAGTLDLNSPASAGYYRLFNYGGTLSGAFDSVTGTGSYTATVYDTVPGQVNVAVLASSQQMQFWDGADTTGDGTVDGGSGAWSDAATNWTGAPGEAGVNAGWVSSVAVFAGASGGTVTVDGAKSFDTLQFSTNGYVLTGDDLQIGVTTGTLTVDSGISTTISSVITDGSGSALQKAGAGTLVLTAANTHTGGTVITAGTLQLGDGGTTGWIDGGVTNSGALAFNRSDDVIFAGDISGSGSVQQSGSGTLVLSGTNTYSGGTIISAGGIKATLASIGSGAITNNASLILDAATDGVFANVLSGTGVFTKTGAGSLSLTGTLTYTGSTFVQAGTLRVNTDLSSSSVFVQTGAVLGGTGTIGGFNATSGATVAPGNSIGTLTVAGNGVFVSGSIYQVEVNAAGQSDLLTATGEIAIQSGVTLSILAEPGSYAASTTYTILSAAGGIVGYPFATVTSSLAFLDASLIYNSNSVDLTLTRNQTGLVDVAETPGQKALVPAIDGLGAGNEIYDSITPLTVSEARNAFSQLSGELYPTVASRLVQDSGLVRDAAMKRLRGTFAALDAPRGGGVEVWGQAYGGWGWQDNGSDYAVARRSAGGVLAGADMPFGSSGVAGVFAGYGSSYIDVASQNAHASANSYHAGAYGGYGFGNVSLRSGTAISWHDLSTRRSIAYRGFSDQLTASPDALTAQVFGELAYGAKVQDVTVEAYSGLAYVHQNNSRFRERGGAAALSATSDSTGTGFLNLGLRARHQFDLAGMAVTAHGAAGWTYAFSDVSSNRSLAFASGGESFSMPGLAVLRNAGVAETGLEMAIAPSASLGVAYRIQAAEEALDQSFKGNLRIRF
ncbi:autotransporter domain-containing protein [Pannonibacter phragmitetus]|uniref:autotransporter domain-containing protein n=1 Tax=Pannonibacter phragmitetus TaxID=121719 RepID=UPI0003AA09CA|nr:autotransporter domain-containing protein [Pannonibacter phragmitetus]